jgi:hypothetical protein
MPVEWKRPAVFGAAFGVATPITLLICGGSIYWLLNRPKGLDSTAIKAVSSRASQTFTVDDEKKEITPSGFELFFVLANTTGRDYTLPEDAKLFKRDVQTGALSELNGKLDHAFFIPAKDKAEVGIEIEYSCGVHNMDTGVTTQQDSQSCYNEAVGSESGFLVLDYSNRVRIELPKPTLTPTPHNPPVQTKDLPPDRGDIFDRVAGCQRAEHLANSCKANHISVGKENVAHYDGWEDPLPSLPMPPPSHELDPSPQVCGTAYQWQNFCRSKN